MFWVYGNITCKRWIIDMKKLRKSLIIFALSATAICGISLSVSSGSSKEVNAYFTPDTTYQNHDADTYYNSISDSLSGTDLLNALRGLNSSRRKKTMGYKTGGVSADDSDFIYTDYDTSDPSTLHTDKNGQTYGTVISSFYSYTPCTSFNKEHVWPNTHGGNKVENDVHMARPTISAENSNRGHSYYVENMAHSTNGWDPYYAFHVNPGKTGDLGEQCINSRGESARIIFYCMVASDQLVLEAGHSDSAKTSNNKMGDLVDILKWNLDISVTEREMNRNEGAEYLQGNRNPFIDHPEYACKIWGNTNDATKKICQSTPPTPTKTLSEIEVSGTPTKTTYVAGESFDLTGLTVTAIYSDGTNKDVTNDVSISPNPLTVGTTSVTLSYTDGVTKSETVSGITVNAPFIPVQSISILNSEFNYTVGSTCELEVGFNPSNASDKSLSYFSSNTSIAKVNSDGIVSFLKAGEVDITVTSGNGKTDVAHFVVSDEVIEVSEVRLTDSTVSLKAGETKELEYTVLPVNATDKSVVWSSSNEEVATVSNEGKVTALKAGTTTIKVSTPDESFFDDCVITVTEEPKPVRTLVEIVVSKNPDKTTYALNEKYDESGLIIEAHYLDGTSEDVTKQCTSNKDQISTSTAGQKSIFYSYESLSLFVPIYVVNDEVTELKITKNPVKLNYFKSEEFSTIGLEVKAIIGGSEVDVTDMIQIECDFEKSNLVTVKFGGLSKEIEVTLESGTITDEHKAVDYTYVFEDKLSDTTKETMTLASWKILEYYYNSLDDATKEVLKKVVTAYGNGEVSAAEGNVEKLKECISDYDEIYLLHKADGFNDFMNRSPKTPAPNPNPGIGDILRKIAIIAGIVVGIIVVIVLIIVISVSASKKGKKKHA